MLLYTNGLPAKELKAMLLKAERRNADSYSGMFCGCDHVVVLGGVRHFELPIFCFSEFRIGSPSDLSFCVGSLQSDCSHSLRFAATPVIGRILSGVDPHVYE